MSSVHLDVIHNVNKTSTSTMSTLKLDEAQVMTQLRNLQKEMLCLSESLHEFSEMVCSENFDNSCEEIVDGSVTNIGTSVTFRIPKMYQVESLFGRLQCLAIARHLFPPAEIKAIEAKLGRKMDKFDTIYVKKPKDGGSQGLMVIRLVRAGDVGSPKL